MFLLGQGIAYSASPAMQEAAFRACGLDWTYELLDLPAERLPQGMARLRAPEVAGANVTIPHKMAVMGWLDDLDDSARQAGAVNTIVNREGRLLGSNTDVSAIREAAAAVAVEPAGAEVVVLGGGGGARAAAAALTGARLTFVVRSPGRAGPLPGRVLAWADKAWPGLVRHADLLVNATPLGRHEEMPLRPAALPPRGAVIDLVYVAGGSPLARKCRSLGLRCLDGWPVLLAQGAAAFQAWTGLPAPVAAMRATLPA